MRTLDFDELLGRVVEAEDSVGFLVYQAVDVRGRSFVRSVWLAQ